MIDFAPAKINIGLYITGKRPDGYHDIVTCMVPIAWFDVIEIVNKSQGSTKMCVYGDFKEDVPSQDNTVLKALRILKHKYGLKLSDVEIHLLKQIPAGTGLGSASSDAATVINAIDVMFDLNMSEAKKVEVAKQIGADVPFFIYKKPAIATGKGEKLELINLPWLGNYFVIIVVPEKRLSTSEMYSRINQFVTPPANFKELIRLGPDSWNDSNMMNQFQPIAEALFPYFKSIKEMLTNMGAKYVSLTGSGSAYYGLFDKTLQKQYNEILTEIRKALNVRAVKEAIFIMV